MSQPYRALGLMSGTSFDGAIEWGVVESDGESVTRLSAGSFDIPAATAQHLRTLLRGAESAFQIASGDVLEAARAFSQDASLTDAGAALNLPVRLDALIERSTLLHVDAARAGLQESGVSVDFVGYHGQTVFHAPHLGKTVQLGDAKLFARELSLRVVSEFRKNDMANGGQGAPIAPVYHEALLRSLNLVPGAWVNIGGISNVTVVRDEIFACDCGPGNSLLDAFMGARTGASRDEDGATAARGVVHEEILGKLIAAVRTADGRSFVTVQGPKSLDKGQLRLIPELDGLSTEDGARTIAECTVRTIASELKRYNVPSVVLSGGGAKNRFFVSRLAELLSPTTIRTATELGLNDESVEAELMGYLAIRSHRGLPLTFPGTTGVSMPVTCGVTFTI